MSGSTPLIEVLLHARSVIHEISAGSQSALSFPVKLQGQILPAFCKLMSKKTPPEYTIKLQKVDVQVRSLRGQLMRYENPHYALIRFSSDQSICWQRFVICKEMAHLVLDVEDSHLTKNVESHIQALISEIRTIELDGALESEYCAMVLALEILVPWKLRPQVHVMRAEGASDLQIAERCRTPEKFINLLLSEFYQKTSRRMNEVLDRDIE